MRKVLIAMVMALSFIFALAVPAQASAPVIADPGVVKQKGGYYQVEQYVKATSGDVSWTAKPGIQVGEVVKGKKKKYIKWRTVGALKSYPYEGSGTKRKKWTFSRPCVQGGWFVRSIITVHAWSEDDYVSRTIPGLKDFMSCK